MTKEIKVLLTDEKLDFLANLYQKIKTNPEFKKRWMEFEMFVNDYIQSAEEAYNEKRNQSSK